MSGGDVLIVHFVVCLSGWAYFHTALAGKAVPDPNVITELQDM